MAITFDTATGNKVGSGTTNTWSHTVVVGQSNEIIIVAVDAGASVSSVTYGGQTMTAVPGGSVTQVGGEVLALYYLLAPPTGANNVVVTCSSTTFIIGISASYYGVAQSSTFGTAATNSSSTAGTSSTNTVTTTSSSQAVIDAVNNEAASTDTATASQNKRFQPGSSGGALGDIAATGSNMTLTWSFSSSNWGQVSVAMNPAAAGVVHSRISDGFGGVFS